MMRIRQTHNVPRAVDSNCHTREKKTVKLLEVPGVELEVPLFINGFGEGKFDDEAQQFL